LRGPDRADRRRPAGAVITLLFAVGLLLPVSDAVVAVVAVGLVVLPAVIAGATLRTKLWDIDTVLGRLLVPPDSASRRCWSSRSGRS